MEIEEAIVFSKMVAAPAWMCQVWLQLCSGSSGFLAGASRPWGRAHRAQLFLPDVWLLSNVFVSKGNRSTSDVALCTMNFALKHRWATSKAQQHSERLFLGTLPYQGGPINLGHTAHQGTHQLKPSCCHMGQAGMLKTSPTLLSKSHHGLDTGGRGREGNSFTCRTMYKLNRKRFK